VHDRFDFIEGDLSEANFGSGYDVATLGHILHSEGEQRSRQLLKKTFRALKSGGTIAIAEWLVNDDRTNRSLADVCRANARQHRTGDTFSFNEIKRVAGGRWLQKVRKLEAPGPSPLILATKP
jgi:ubiquinone/menaquinone biosynthesis C-methylase UbiE